MCSSLLFDVRSCIPGDGREGRSPFAMNICSFACGLSSGNRQNTTTAVRQPNEHTHLASSSREEIHSLLLGEALVRDFVVLSAKRDDLVKLFTVGQRQIRDSSLTDALHDDLHGVRQHLNTLDSLIFSGSFQFETRLFKRAVSALKFSLEGELSRLGTQSNVFLA